LNNKLKNPHLNYELEEELYFTPTRKIFVIANYGFVHGDILVFTLKAMSEVQFYTFENDGFYKIAQIMQASITFEMNISHQP
jgi:hypothetical protein